MAFNANYPYRCELCNGNHPQGEESVFLVGIAGPGGMPTPATQLVVKREERTTGMVTRITEQAKRGTRVIATRSYEHQKYARSPERQTARDTARWTSPTGSEVRVWCHMVSVACARARGFRVSSYVKPARPGSRTVGHEDQAIAARQVAELNRAAERAVPAAPGEIEGPIPTPFNPYKNLVPEKFPESEPVAAKPEVFVPAPVSTGVRVVDEGPAAVAPINPEAPAPVRPLELD